jgi:predicted nicotinamide N-methyase
VTQAELASFIAAQTRPASAALVPEIRLHLATEVTPLWQATEATLATHNLPPPYWAFAWPGGQALARHVLDHPDIVRRRRVLDFAAGGGIAAIAAARCGAVVSATEIDAVAAAALSMNAALNAVTVAVLAADLTARDPAAVALEWEIVLAGDVFYERPMAERVEPWLRGLVRQGTTVLVADPGRSYLPKDGLTEFARYVVPTSRDLEDRESRETRVFRMTA